MVAGNGILLGPDRLRLITGAAVAVITTVSLAEAAFAAVTVAVSVSVVLPLASGLTTFTLKT